MGRVIKMNFSDYTLVSFGDSFTFGQGAGKDTRESLIQKNPDSIAGWQIEYRNQSNENSYTRFISDELKFKNYLNAANPGASNGSILFNLSRFLTSNKDKKVFIIVGLTLPDREFYITKFNDRIKDDSELSTRYLSESVWSSNIPQALRNKRDKELYPPTLKLSDRWFNDYFGYWVNKENIYFRSFNEIYTIIKLLQESGHPHIVVDVINDLNKIIDKNFNIGFSNLYDRNYEDRIMDSAESLGLNNFSQSNKLKNENFLTTTYEIYKNELEQSMLTHEYMWDFLEKDTSKKLEKRSWINLSGFLNYHFLLHNNNTKNNVLFGKKYLSNHKDDLHWNEYSHRLVASLIVYYIRKSKKYE